MPRFVTQIVTPRLSDRKLVFTYAPEGKNFGIFPKFLRSGTHSPGKEQVEGRQHVNPKLMAGEGHSLEQWVP